MYIQRPLAKTILGCTSKVVILEGARAVGKTALARNELAPAGYSYYSLTDQNEYEYARNNITEWVNGLSLPAIVDEAQRISDLPLAIKDRVDKLPAQGTQVILTGSASINRRGLEGQDPLARRSRRFTLHPLTRREILGNQQSIVDDLWSGFVNPAYRSSIARQELYDTMSIGGFPRYAVEGGFVSTRERNLAIKDDIDGVLGDTILPGEQLDRTIAHAILKDLLSLPGAILNKSRLADNLQYDSRTIDRYVSIFESRFLIRLLPNLRLAAHRQGAARSKVHPVDTSFTCEMLAESGKDPLRDPVLFGGVFESFVVNQIVSAIPWSAKLPDPFYWRETGKHPKEVDLVLVSENEMVGIEVKASSNISGSDFNGLKALMSDDRFTRGFVFYTGDKVIRNGENLWALPVTALWEREAFMPQNALQKNTVPCIPQSSPNVTVAEEQPVQPADAQILLSYRHDDNTYLGNAIVRFAEDIVQEYEFLYAASLELFVDAKSIDWGEQWKRVFDSAVDATTFIMPAVTPRYIASPSCRDELQRFVSRGEEAANGHILSLVWQEYHGTSAADQNPSIVAILDKYQHRDVSGLRGLDPSDATYRQTVSNLAKEIHDRVINDSKTTSPAPSTPTEGETRPKNQENGLIEQMATLTDTANEFGESLVAVVADLQNIQGILNAHPAPHSGNASALAVWCNAIAKDTREPVKELRSKLASSRDAWNRICETTQGYIEIVRIMRDAGQPVDAESLRLQLLTIRTSLDQMGNLRSQLAPLSVLTVLSPKLRLLVDGLNELVNTVEDMRAALDDLISQAGSIR